MPIGPDELYHRVGGLLANTPDLYARPVTDETRAWLGQACALVEASGNIADQAKIVTASDRLEYVGRDRQVRTILNVLQRTFARAELAAPAVMRGTYLPVGAHFGGLAAVVSILRPAGESVLFVDAYADANLLTEFAVQAPEGVNVQVLSDEATKKPGLAPALERWEREYGDLRPIDCRLSEPRALHDRLIIVDWRDVYSVGQSFNAIAQRSPTAILRVDDETAGMKIDGYRALWDAATPLE